MNVTKAQLKKIIKEETEKLLIESQSEEQVRELSSVIDDIDDIGNLIDNPQIVKALDKQVQRLANVHDKLEALLRDTGIVDRRPDW